MSHETTAPVTSLVDEVLAELTPLFFISEQQIPLLGKSPYFAHRKEAEGLFQAGVCLVSNAQLLLEANQKELTSIEAMVRMLEENEWAEHVGLLGGPIARRLEAEITRMHNEQQAAPVAVLDVREAFESAWANVMCSGKPARSRLAERDYAGGAAQFAWDWWNRAALSQQAAPPAQQSQADERREGVEAVAKMIEKKASDYAMEFGHDELGALSFGAGPYAEAKHDYYNTLCELAEEVRAMLAVPGDTAAPEQVEQPASHELLPDEIHQIAFEEGQPAENGDGYWFTAEEFDLFVDRLLTRAAPPAQQGQWVPASERLPEIDTPVFLYEPNFGIWIGGCADADDGWMWAHAQGTQWFADGKWKADLFIDDDYKPSHWMPLPSAPGDTAAPEQKERVAIIGKGVASTEALEQAEQPASYVDDLIERLGDAQQEINLAANTTMSQALCSASALLDEVEVALRRYTAPPAAEPDAVTVPRGLLECYLNGGGDWVEAGHKLRDLLGGGA